MQSNSSQEYSHRPHEARVAALRLRHANFDRQIQELRGSPSATDQIAALKKNKLRIKDEIARLGH